MHVEKVTASSDIIESYIEEKANLGQIPIKMTKIKVGHILVR